MKFKHVVITGASSGIGECLAYAHAEPGVLISLTGRNEERLSGVAAQSRAMGAEVETAILDVIDRAGMKSWLEAREKSRPIDLVIANAGISGGTGGNAVGENDEQTRQLFDVNVTGVLNTVDPVLPHMIKRGSGHIALMSSLAGFRGWPGAPAYCATKAAVKVYGEGLRGSLIDSGVGVSVICPGFVRSRMTAVNDFPMPWIMDTDRAAAIIKKGVEKNKGRIAFPFRAFLFSWAFSVMPDAMAQLCLKKMPEKPALKNN